jgi:cell division protein ZapA
MTAKKTTVKVTIAGEEYAIRTDTSPEHARAVAAYVDRVLKGVLSTGATVERHRVAILAALQITDELFRAREGHAELAEEMRTLATDVRRWLPPARRLSGEFPVQPER